MTNKEFFQSCWMFMFDIIHHRGQLSTCYRPMEAVQPPIYGPTAEMVEEMMTKNNCLTRLKK